MDAVSMHRRRSHYSPPSDPLRSHLRFNTDNSPTHSQFPSQSIDSTDYDDSMASLSDEEDISSSITRALVRGPLATQRLPDNLPIFSLQFSSSFSSASSRGSPDPEGSPLPWTSPRSSALHPNGGGFRRRRARESPSTSSMDSDLDFSVRVDDRSIQPSRGTRYTRSINASLLSNDIVSLGESHQVYPTCPQLPRIEKLNLTPTVMIAPSDGNHDREAPVPPSDETIDRPAVLGQGMSAQPWNAAPQQASEQAPEQTSIPIRENQRSVQLSPLLIDDTHSHDIRSPPQLPSFMSQMSHTPPPPHERQSNSQVHEQLRRCEILLRGLFIPDAIILTAPDLSIFEPSLPNGMSHHDINARFTSTHVTFTGTPTPQQQQDYSGCVEALQDREFMYIHGKSKQHFDTMINGERNYLQRITADNPHGFTHPYCSQFDQDRAKFQSIRRRLFARWTGTRSSPQPSSGVAPLPLSIADQDALYAYNILSSPSVRGYLSQEVIQDVRRQQLTLPLSTILDSKLFRIVRHVWSFRRIHGTGHELPQSARVITDYYQVNETIANQIHQELHNDIYGKYGGGVKPIAEDEFYYMYHQWPTMCDPNRPICNFFQRITNDNPHGFRPDEIKAIEKAISAKARINSVQRFLTRRFQVRQKHPDDQFYADWLDVRFAFNKTSYGIPFHFQLYTIGVFDKPYSTTSASIAGDLDHDATTLLPPHAFLLSKPSSGSISTIFSLVEENTDYILHVRALLNRSGGHSPSSTNEKDAGSKYSAWSVDHARSHINSNAQTAIISSPLRESIIHQLSHPTLVHPLDGYRNLNHTPALPHFNHFFLWIMNLHKDHKANVNMRCFIDFFYYGYASGGIRPLNSDEFHMLSWTIPPSGEDSPTVYPCDYYPRITPQNPHGFTPDELDGVMAPIYQYLMEFPSDDSSQPQTHLCFPILCLGLIPNGVQFHPTQRHIGSKFVNDVLFLQEPFSTELPPYLKHPYPFLSSDDQALAEQFKAEIPLYFNHLSAHDYCHPALNTTARIRLEEVFTMFYALQQSYQVARRILKARWKAIAAIQTIGAAEAPPAHSASDTIDYAKWIASRLANNFTRLPIQYSLHVRNQHPEKLSGGNPSDATRFDDHCMPHTQRLFQEIDQFRHFCKSYDHYLHYCSWLGTHFHIK